MRAGVKTEEQARDALSDALVLKWPSLGARGTWDSLRGTVYNSGDIIQFSDAEGKLIVGGAIRFRSSWLVHAHAGSVSTMELKAYLQHFGYGWVNHR